MSQPTNKQRKPSKKQKQQQQQQNAPQATSRKKAKRKAKTGTYILAALPAASRDALQLYGVGIDDQPLDAMAEYRRKDETEMLIPENNIVTQLDGESKLNSRRAYYIQWLVPSPQNNRGTLLSLDRFVIRLHNTGAFDLEVVAQQPHGYERSPGSVAAWVQLASRTVKAGDHIILDVKPISNENVVPLRSTLSGADCVVPLALSLTRQALSNSGSEVPKSEVGASLVVEAYYRASGNVVQSGRFFGLRTYSDDTSMSVVDAVPPIPVPINTVHPEVGRVEFIATKMGDNNALALIGIQDHQGEKIPSENFTGLDRNHIYALPYAVEGIDKNKKPYWGSYVKYLKGGVGWIVCRNTSNPPEIVYEGDNSTTARAGSLPQMHGSLYLTPISNSVFKALPVQNRKLSNPMVLARLQSHNLTALQLGDWKDDVLHAVSFIVGVVKVAAAVAGAAGLLNVVNADEE